MSALGRRQADLEFQARQRLTLRPSVKYKKAVTQQMKAVRRYSAKCGGTAQKLLKAGPRANAVLPGLSKF